MNNRAKIFISSVFRELEDKDSVLKKAKWNLRYQLYDLLRVGYNPWMWEVEGEEEKSRTNLFNEDIISKAICSSDLVIIFYKKRAGSFFNKNIKIPFYATDYEMAEAIRNGVPIKLFVIGNAPTFRLQGVLSLYTNPIISGTNTIECSDDSDAVHKALLEVTKISTTPRSSILSLQQYNLGESNDSIYSLGTLYYKLSNLTDIGDYTSAIKLIRENFFVYYLIPTSNEEKVLKARCLSIFANVYANSTLYVSAIDCSSRSIRLYMESGEWEYMFAEIQALSGIQNMAGNGSARWLNAYGFRTLRIYSNLSYAYRDSRASIYRNMGHYEVANKLLEESSDWEKSPYSAAKYAYLKGFSNNSNLSRARQLIEYEILPWSRQVNRTLSYVLRTAAELSLKDRDLMTTTKYLMEAEELSRLEGSLHTLSTIVKLKQQINA